MSLFEVSFQIYTSLWTCIQTPQHVQHILCPHPLNIFSYIYVVSFDIYSSLLTSLYIYICLFWRLFWHVLKHRGTSNMHCYTHILVQPNAFGVLSNLNLQSQSHRSFFSGTWQKRPRELDIWLRFESEEITLQMHKAVTCVIMILFLVSFHIFTSLLTCTQTPQHVQHVLCPHPLNIYSYDSFLGLFSYIYVSFDIYSNTAARTTCTTRLHPLNVYDDDSFLGLFSYLDVSFDV